MILVDTSVWINHLRNNDPHLVRLLSENSVLGHHFVHGELVLGNLRQRETILGALDNLRQAPMAFTTEVNVFIERHALYGLGIGLIDTHLLASTRLSGNTQLWAQDKRLLAAANRLNLAAPHHD